MLEVLDENCHVAIVIDRPLYHGFTIADSSMKVAGQLVECIYVWRSNLLSGTMIASSGFKSVFQRGEFDT
jgi:hypothetical protein